jgi:hypothetical protein
MDERRLHPPTGNEILIDGEGETCWAWSNDTRLPRVGVVGTRGTVSAGRTVGIRASPSAGCSTCSRGAAATGRPSRAGVSTATRRGVNAGGSRGTGRRTVARRAIGGRGSSRAGVATSTRRADPIRISVCARGTVHPRAATRPGKTVERPARASWRRCRVGQVAERVVVNRTSGHCQRNEECVTSNPRGAPHRLHFTKKGRLAVPA